MIQECRDHALMNPSTYSRELITQFANRTKPFIDDILAVPLGNSKAQNSTN